MSRKYNQQQKNLFIGFFAAVLCLSILVGFSIRTVRESIKDEQSVGHSHQVKSALFQFLSDAADALSSERGYLLSGSQLDLENLESADKKIVADINQIRANVLENPKQSQLMNVLEEDANVFRARLKQKVLDRDKRGLQALLKDKQTGINRQIMSNFKELLTAIDAEEDLILSESIKRRQGESAKAEGLILLGGILVISLLTGSLVIMLRDMKKIELHSKQIAESSKVAALGEMAGGIAHEINNPLAVIRAHAQLLIAYCNQSDFQASLFLKSAGKIDETVQRIAQIVKSMLMLARNVQSDDKKPVRLSEVIESSVEMCKSRLRLHGKEVDLRVFHPNENLLIHCRPIELSQVLINLLNNSLDAVSDCPQPWIELRVEEAESEVKISVTDSGKGIALNNRSRIMEPFFTTKEAGRGTGLGLSVSKAIVESHGGNLLLNDRLKHTCFEIHLPKGSPLPQIPV